MLLRRSANNRRSVRWTVNTNRNSRMEINFMTPENQKSEHNITHSKCCCDGGGGGGGSGGLCCCFCFCCSNHAKQQTRTTQWLELRWKYVCEWQQHLKCATKMYFVCMFSIPKFCLLLFSLSLLLAKTVRPKHFHNKQSSKRKTVTITLYKYVYY